VLEPASTEGLSAKEADEPRCGTGDASTSCGKESGDASFDVGEDLDLGESLIAIAMREAGIDPTTLDISELVSTPATAPQPLAASHSARSLRSSGSGGPTWHESSKSWATERLRRKK
ncbi:unnamed protein product, partial [Polarella glacialis]